MIKRLAFYTLIIGLLLVVWVAAHYYPELSAVLWHVRHGSQAEVRGIRFPVPLAYEVSESHGLPTLLMIKTAGHAWPGGGMIDIDFHKQPAPLSPEAIRMLQSKGLQTKFQVMGEQMATLAGRPGKCTEGLPQFGDPRLDETIRKLNVLEIDCWFGGEVEVTFRGTPTLKDEFYSVIRGAAPVQGKR